MRLDGERVEGLQAPRIRSLLTYLLLHRDAPQPRARVAFLLWPDSTEPQARTNLRQLLHHLRRALPDPDRFLIVDTATIGWRLEAPYRLDVAAFEGAVARADRATEPREVGAALAEAADNYGGDLLPGCYEEWILPERERLRQAHLDVLERLTRLLEEGRDYQAAIRHAEELLRHDPLHEATYRRLMRLHALAGERARALRIYHTCATTLRRELGVDPSPKTRKAHGALLRAEERPGPAGDPEVPTTPLVGRQRAWAACLASFREVAAGRTRVLLVRGEAGIGKTRLIEEFEVWCRRQGHLTARARAYPAEGRLAYAPIVEWLRSDALRGAPRRLEDAWLAEIARLLPELRTDRPDLPAPVATTTAEERQRLFHALARAILSVERPLLLVLDDAQWCDRETLEFLHFLARRQRRTPLLLLVTLRPEEVGSGHPAHSLVTGLQRLEVLTAVELGPLARTLVGELVAHLRGRPGSPEEDAALHRMTGGNPLFVVETVREEGGHEPTASAAGSGARPSKVEAVIERRLGQLSPEARAIVGLAGIIGREFTGEVLRQASDLQESELVDVLDELWRRRIIHEHGATAYDFVHDRIREVAAGLVGPARARALHLRVAAALERINDQHLDAASAQIAHHFDGAGEVERALAYYRRAAAHAQGLSAIAESAGLLRRALRLLEELPAGPDRDHRELELETALGVRLVALDGYGGARALHAYRRARELCGRLGRPVDPPVLRGLALGAITRAELADAERFTRQLLATEEAPDDLLDVEGHYLLGVISFWRGDFLAARRHLERAIEHYDPAVSRTHLRLYAQDPKVVCLIRLAYDLWYLGEPDRTRTLRGEAIALAEQLGDPTTSAYALTFACWIANELGDTDDVARFAAATAAVAEEHQLGFFLPMGQILTGWVTATSGDRPTGITEIREGLAMLEERDQRLPTSYGLALLARTHLLAGDPAAARVAVDDALDLTDRTGQRYLESDLRRLHGGCLAAQGDHGDAQAAFDAALAAAHRQASPALVLRAATAGAVHLLETGLGGQQEALATLIRVRDRFADHHDTSDLRTADDLLRQTGVA